MTAGTPIELYVTLDLPPLTVRDAVMHVMQAIGERKGRYRDLSLWVDSRTPGAGSLNVPIDARVVTRPGRWECGVRIEAAHSEKFFPAFEGTVSVTPDGGHQSELWLQGQYVPPGGALGKGLDATVLRGVAERSLREFLKWLSEEVKAEAERSERERLDQARHYHG
ncbi:MAG TPA: hypothetical protein VFN49_06930 [Candidatus Aquilonibacter sp.]|nr:hypothetical protein [Candidatus Aquilonibacter sp.]